MRFHNSTLSKTTFAAIILVTLSACGKGEGDGKKPATQVAAKVDSEEISVHQVNQVLSRSKTSGTTPQALQAMSREALERLIDQQLAVSQAEKKDIHRTPDVVAQLEAVRREVLARAYLQQLGNALPKPSEDEIKKYYADYPQLFSARRVFNVQEIVVPSAAGVADKLRSFASGNKPIEDAAAWLKSGGVKFGGGSATRAAEQIPLELLSKLHALKDGQSIVIESPQVVTLLRIASSQLAPVAEAAALPRIEQFLGNQRSSAAVAAELKRLRAEAKIAYLGDFSKSTESASPPPTAPVTSTVGNGNQSSVANPADPNKAMSAIEKGVAGLK